MLIAKLQRHSKIDLVFSVYCDCFHILTEHQGAQQKLHFVIHVAKTAAWNEVIATRENMLCCFYTLCFVHEQIQRVSIVKRPRVKNAIGANMIE